RSRSLAASSSMPSLVFLLRKLSPVGTTCTSSQSCETSMPTKCASILSHPCLNGLRLQRPRRLFGFDGTADVDPCSPTGLVSPGGCGLASATAPTMIADAAGFNLQGGPEDRRGLVEGNRSEIIAAPELRLVFVAWFLAAPFVASRHFPRSRGKIPEAVCQGIQAECFP